jgi:hypothetical protein
MDLFLRKHQKKINETLGCFDRMLFRGYLPIQSGRQMAIYARALKALRIYEILLLIRKSKVRKSVES